MKTVLRAGAFCACISALCAQTSSDTSQTVKLPEFTVSANQESPYRSNSSISAARVRGDLIETPASISVVTREFLDDVAAVRLYDATRYVAGITEGRGPTFQDRVQIRGFENSNRTVDNFLLAANSNVDEALVERVEVVKGPNTILSPTGTPGGSINVITKSPEFTARNQLTGVAGLYDAQRVSLDSTGPVPRFDKFAYRFIGVYQDSQRNWDNSRLRVHVLNPQLTFKPRDGTTVTAKYLYSESGSWGDPRVLVDDSVTNGATAVKAPGFSRSGRNGAESWNQRTTRLHKFDVALNSSLTDSISMRLAADYVWVREGSELSQLNYPGTGTRYDPYTGQLTPDYTWSAPAGSLNYTSTYSPYFDPTNIPRISSLGDTSAQNFSVQNDYAAAYRLSGVSTTTVAGWVFNHGFDDGKSATGKLPNFDLFAPVYGARPVYSSGLATHTNDRNDSKQAYVLEKAGFLDDRLFVSGGASRVWVHSRSNNLLSHAFGTLDGQRDTYFGGVLGKVTANTSVYYSYSTNANASTFNNQPLWSNGVQHEVGIKADFFKRRLGVTLAGFDITQNNVVIPNPEYQINKSVPQFLLYDLKSRGVELEATGSINANWSVIGSITRMRARDSFGRRPRAIADKAAGLLLRYQFTNGALKNLSLSLGASYTGDQAVDSPPAKTVLGVIAQPSTFVPGYTTVTATAGYRWHQYVFRLTGDNILNSDYLYSPGARFAVAESPRPNVRLTATMTF